MKINKMRFESLFTIRQFDDIVALFYRVLLGLYVILNLHSQPFFAHFFLLIVGVLIFWGYYIFKLSIVFKKTPYLLDTIIDILFAWIVLSTYKKLDWSSYSFIFFLLLFKNLSRLSYIHIIILYGSLSAIIIQVNHEFSIKTIIPFIFFYLFLRLEIIIYQMTIRQRKFNQIIDDFFLTSNGRKSYNIYKEAIILLNKQPFGIDIKDIFCFRKNGETLFLVNGTKFTWNYSIQEDSQTIKMIFKQNQIFKNLSLELDGKLMNKNFCIIHKNEELKISYLFVILTDKSINEFSLSTIMLPHFFARMSKIVEFEYRIKESERIGLFELKQKMQYVNNATNTMHFIRNKLSPLKDYIAMRDYYEKNSNEEKEKVKPHLDKEFMQVKKSFNLILLQANQMLEKSNNPFVFSQTECYGLQQLFSDFKFIWQSYGLDESKIKVELLEKVKGERKFIYYNKVGLNIVLDNWISNMTKYNNGDYGIQLIEEEQCFSLLFFNNYKKGKEKEDIVTLYNENKKAEITKRQFHGLNAIKDYLEQMNIHSRMLKKDHIIYLNLTFYKKTEKEDEKDSNY